jgi:hypothetical protein
MKKSYFLLLSILFVVFSCNKYENGNPAQEGSGNFTPAKYENVAIPLDWDAKAQSGSYGLTLQCGHSGANCSGCVMSGGMLRHIDCMGAGTECTVNVSVSIIPFPDGQFKAVTIGQYDLTTDDQFLLPNRSLYVVSNSRSQTWLNISEQLTIRDSVTGQFVIKGVTFTDYQLHENQR